MESPPQFPGAPKKSKTGLILGLSALAIVLCCCGVCGGGAFFFKDVLKKGVGLAECGMALAQQRDGVVAYAKKHGGKLPGGTSWQDDIAPFVTPVADNGKRGDMVHIPTPTENVCDRTANTSVVYNEAVAGKTLDAIKDQDSTVLLFEAPGPGRNKTQAWHEPDFKTSPILLKTERRGWLRQPIQGQGFYKDKFGNNRPAPSATGGMNQSFGSVDVISKPSKGNDGV